MASSPRTSRPTWIVTAGRCSAFRRPRESGGLGASNVLVALDSRFRGEDENRGVKDAEMTGTGYAWDFSFLWAYRALILTGLGVTVAYAIGTILLGLIVGLVT